MAAKDSRQTGHCRSGEAGAEVLGVATWQLLEVEMVLVVLVVEETEMVGESVRSMVMLSWPEFPASGELLAGLDDSSETTTS